MNIKIGKFEAKVSGIMLFVVATIADNMYENHCKKKAVGKYLDVMKDLEKEEKGLK